MNAIKSLFIASLLLCTSALFAQDISLLSKTYRPGIKEGTLVAWFADIEKQAGVSISFSSSSVDVNKTIKLPATETTVRDILSMLLAGEKVSVQERKDKILLVPDDKPRRALREKMVTVNGFIKELGSKEVLIGAVVYVPGTQAGTVTNSYGYYSLTIPEGGQTIVSAYVGYKPDTVKLTLKDDVRRDVLMGPETVLTEVKVVSDNKPNNPGQVRLSYEDITERPALFGETEIMRALQNNAGVSSGTEGTNSVLVRGGEPGQNLNLLDGVALYYIDHFFGITSIFNSDAIKSVDFHKGAFPSRYGGRVSSVIDINTKDGDMQHWGGQANMGLVKGSATIEGPIIKDKSSIMISGRRTWIDGFWRFFTSDLKLDFYDINAKANYILDKNNRLYVSFYNGRDQFGVKIDNGDLHTRWGNTVGMVKWTNIVSPKLFINTIATYNQFRYELNDTREIITEGTIADLGTYKGKSSINDASLRFSANWYPSLSHKVEAGISYSNAHFTPVSLETQLSENAADIIPYAEKFQSNEVVLYAEDEIKLNRKWTFRPGVHFANWFGSTFSYSSLQPRLYTGYSIAPKHTLYASFTQMAQFLHLISNNTYGLPTDFWIPSTDDIAPEESYMAAMGYAGKPLKGMAYNVEVYYKDIQNVTTYNMGKGIFDNSKQWSDNIIQGTGNSYGAEFSLQQKLGKFRFLSCYTLSWTWRQFAELNEGKRFPYRFDRRHNIKVGVIFKASEEFDMSANWTYMSGEAITLPDQIYPDFDRNLLIDPGYQFSSSEYTYNYVQWNNYRLPAVHRLDIVANFNKIKSKRVTRTWSVGVYNAYAHSNIMFVQLVNNADGSFVLNGISALQFIPYISYRLKF
jgi:outer membrane receptor for ferrienterochelin and colicin